MTPFLGPDWFARLEAASRQLPEEPGASAELTATVTRRGGDDVRVRLRVENARIVELDPTGDATAPLELACPEAVAAAIVQGTTSVAVAFMRGELKVNGDMGAMHRLLPLTGEPGFVAMLAELAAETDF